MLFEGKKETLPEIGFNPRNLPKTGALFTDGTSLAAKTDKDKDSNNLMIYLKVIIFVGSPGSGKSTFCNNHLPNYERVNRDLLKTKEKCWKVCEDFLA